jgi:hypothetical protein
MVRRPRVLILVSLDERALVMELFARRGFATVVVSSPDDARAFLAGCGEEIGSAAAVIDLRIEWAVRALAALVSARQRVVVVGVVDSVSELSAIEAVTDAALSRPIDPELLFTTVVSHLSDRRRAVGKRPVGRQAALTGIVGPVAGNDLFQRIVEELETVVLPVNAGAILENAADEIGSSPFRLSHADVQALMQSGRLAEALAELVPGEEVEFVLERLRALTE